MHRSVVAIMWISSLETRLEGTHKRYSVWRKKYDRQDRGEVQIIPLYGCFVSLQKGVQLRLLKALQMSTKKPKQLTRRDWLNLKSRLSKWTLPSDWKNLLPFLHNSTVKFFPFLLLLFEKRVIVVSLSLMIMIFLRRYRQVIFHTGSSSPFVFTNGIIACSSFRSQRKQHPLRDTRIRNRLQVHKLLRLKKK